MTQTLAFVIWLALLALAVPYVRRFKHPQAKTLAAYLLFVMVFSVISSGMLVGVLRIAIGAGQAGELNGFVWALLLLALVFVPAFLVAHWVIRRPPWNRPVPK